MKIVIAGFAMYVLGFVVLYLSAFELGAVALAVLIRRTIVYEPWRNSEWRRVASVFLGSELSPPVEDIPTEPPRDEPAPTTNVEKLSRTIKDNFTRAMAPHNYQARWQKWYDVLRVYFPAPQNPQLAFGNFYFSVLNSIGFAGLASAYISHCHVGWLVWLTCILTIAVVHISFITSFSQQQHADSSGNQLAAEIFKTIKKSRVVTRNDRCLEC